MESEGRPQVVRDAWQPVSAAVRIETTSLSILEDETRGWPLPPDRTSCGVSAEQYLY
jgi:hypothetical protein